MSAVDDTYLLVMEYVEGLDLAEVSRRLGPLAIADACELVRQAAIGLQYAHEHGLVHRDIKPANLMLHPSSQAAGDSGASVKILDLGLALLSEDRRDAAVEEELTTAGTRWARPTTSLRSRPATPTRSISGPTCTVWVARCTSC